MAPPPPPPRLAVLAAALLLLTPCSAAAHARDSSLMRLSDISSLTARPGETRVYAGEVRDKLKCDAGAGGGAEACGFCEVSSVTITNEGPSDYGGVMWGCAATLRSDCDLVSHSCKAICETVDVGDGDDWVRRGSCGVKFAVVVNQAKREAEARAQRALDAAAERVVEKEREAREAATVRARKDGAARIAARRAEDDRRRADAAEAAAHAATVERERAEVAAAAASADAACSYITTCGSCAAQHNCAWCPSAGCRRFPWGEEERRASASLILYLR